MKFYCHYDLSKSEISKIASHNKKDESESDMFIFEIDESIALSMLSGDTNTQDWIISKVEDSEGLMTLIPKVKDTINKMVRVDGAFLVEVKHGMLSDICDAHIILNENESSIVVYLNKVSVINSTAQNLELFFIHEHDISYVKFTITINLDELRELLLEDESPNDKFIKNQFEMNSSLNNVSILTIKIFNNITMEIL